METECISLLEKLTQEEKSVLVSMIEESLNSMLPVGITENEIDDYKRVDEVWKIQETILKKLVD